MRFIFLGICLIFSVNLKAASDNDELKRLLKCYGLFTNDRITEDNPLWVQVKNGQKTGTQACMEVLEEGMFTDGQKTIKKNGSEYTDTGRRVLKTFLSHYKSQFRVPSPYTRLGNESRTGELVDANQSAYQFMYSLFKPNEPFSNVVTRPHSIRSIRYSKKTQQRQRSSTLDNANSLLQNKQPEMGYCLQASSMNGGKWDSVCAAYMWRGLAVFLEIPGLNRDNGTPVPDQTTAFPAEAFYPTVVQTGLLVGLEPDMAQNLLPHLAGEINNININANVGGGALGDQAYFIANFNFLSAARFYLQDGAVHMQRRYGENVMSDFLCRTNPLLRSMDVVDEVKLDSTISFRQGISCMTCHAGMDGLSAVVRNVSMFDSLNTSYRHGTVRFMATPKEMNEPYWRNKPREVLAKTGSINGYHLTANLGRLFYRSYDGGLIKEDFEGFADLGSKISKKDDYYTCAAKKHFKMLTGIDVNLGDEGDINFPELTAAEKKYRDQVIKLGKELKGHQSLKNLIKAIIQSPTFIRPDKGV